MLGVGDRGRHVAADALLHEVLRQHDDEAVDAGGGVHLAGEAVHGDGSEW